MSKRGKLSKVELEYITENVEKLSAGDMAKNLDRTLDSVKQAIVKLGLENKEDNNKVTQARPGRAGKLMGRHVRNKQVVATVMTQEASEANDDFRKVNLSRHTESAVFKPLGEGSFESDGNFKPKN